MAESFVLLTFLPIFARTKEENPLGFGYTLLYYIGIMNEKENKQQGLQLELPQDVAQGEYANFAIITHSSSDFIIDFARVLPGVPKAQVKSRVILAPEHAKRLLGALQENIFRYEREFGQIKIPTQQERTIAPFDVTKGEA
jgi:hypothetical protein